ncbi:MAG TPA: hypothetical protein VHH36_07490 [Candidatus Thermoplasmatota archaeon]|nr:hypothetical protein [Candidatus Thermoplasmatota archaeon]
MRRLSTAVTTLLLLLLPLAAAQAAQGEFVFAGTATASDWVSVRGASPVLLSTGPGVFQSIEVRAAKLHVTVYQMNSTWGPANVYAPSEVVAERTFVDASLTFDDLAAHGFVGLAGAWSTQVASTRLATFTGVDSATYTTATGDADANGGNAAGRFFGEQELPEFVETVDRPHVASNVTGAIAGAGDGRLHVLGPDGHVRAADGAFDFTTVGPEESEVDPLRPPGALQTHRWAVVELEGATFSLVAGEPVVLALDGAQIAVDGTLALAAAVGDLAGSGATYFATGGPVEMTGNFTASLLPVPGSSDVRLALQGDLRGTTMPAVHAPAAASPPASPGLSFDPLLLLPLVGVALAAPAAGYAVWRRRHPKTTVEEYVAYATLAADAGDPARAVEWLRRARRLAPASARLPFDEAQYLAMMGAVEEAVAAYRDAHERSKDGKAAFEAALLLATVGDLGGCEAWLAHSLSRSPELAWAVEGEPGFAPLHGRPRFEGLIADALQRT